MSGISKNQKIMLLVGNLVVGFSSVIIFKQQSKCSATIDGITQPYNHPFMQVFTMYVGEAICIVIYVIHKHYNKEKYEQEEKQAIEEGKIPKINPLILTLPTVCDFVTSSLAFFALEMIPSSVYSMVRGGNVIITAIFSVIFLKTKLYRHHILGMGFLILGLAVVGLVEVLSQKGGDQDTFTFVLGIILLVSSFFTYSTQVILEQKYFSKYQLNPFQVVGIEGSWGILMSGIAVIIFNYIPCSSKMECPISSNGKMYLEDAKLFFQQIFSFSNQPDQPVLIIMIFLGILAILFFNVLQMSVTKFISSLARNVISVTVPLFVWMASLALGWEKFLWGQLIGFLILSVGSLIYNEILVIPFFGLDQNTKKNIKKREQEQLIGTSTDNVTDYTDDNEDFNVKN